MTRVTPWPATIPTIPQALLIITSKYPDFWGQVSIVPRFNTLFQRIPSKAVSQSSNQYQVQTQNITKPVLVWFYLFAANQTSHFLLEQSIFALLFSGERRLLCRRFWILPWSSSTLDSSTNLQCLLGMWILSKRNLPFLRVNRSPLSWWPDS